MGPAFKNGADCWLTTSKVIDKSKDLAHSAGKVVEKGGKLLQKV